MSQLSTDLPTIMMATSFPPKEGGGGGAIIRQLIRGIPAERLAWWSCTPAAPSETQHCAGHFRSGNLPSRLLPYRRFTETKSAILESFWVPSAAKGLQEFISQRNPDMLWLLSDFWAAPVLYRAVRDLGIPWHISVHDFADTAGVMRRLGKRRAGRFRRMVEDLYAGAVSRDVVSPEMADELERVTGCKADHIIRCAVDPEDLDFVRSKQSVPPTDKLRIAYPGTIIAEETFSKFVAALRLVQRRLSLPIELHLFSGHSYRDRSWFDPSLIVERGFLFAKNLESAYQQCHWGLTIMELDDSNPRYNRFSFPCKFTQTLAGGLPNICIGHPQSSLIRLAGRYNLGPVITSSDVHTIAEALLSAFANPPGFPRLREEILRCVTEGFDADRNRQALYSSFRRARA